jgi:16S rRNA G966 N2-methylase RsmD
MAPVAGNLLYFGDNLDILRRHVEDASVDVVYVDPPFNSNASYNGATSRLEAEREPCACIATRPPVIHAIHGRMTLNSGVSR